MSLLKKFAAATLALTMTLSLAACGGSDAPARCFCVHKV